MPIFEIDPLKDPRWGVLVDSHPQSSVFHTPQWLEALRRTYRFTPRAFTLCPPDAELTNGIVFCAVESWLTGARLVSLPFSDHCEPLVQQDEELCDLLIGIRKIASGKYKYAEVRPRFANLQRQPDLFTNGEHYLHVLDLRPSLVELYSRLHKDSIQRKIRRSEREGLVVEHGRSDVLLKQFYELLLMTRRRHRLPPQPLVWFRNLIDSFGEPLTIYVASSKGRPIASILTLRHGRTLMYKYGCSDEEFHPLGGMPRLFWDAIQRAKSEDLTDLDLGRSEPGHAGLIRFKDRLGAATTNVKYWRLFKTGNSDVTASAMHSSLMQAVISSLPNRIFQLVGEMFYRHVG